MANFKHISVADTAKKITDDVVSICDIRDINAFNAAHMAGAFHLTNQSMPRLLNELDFSRPLVVVCYHGNSSQGAAQYLVEQGFEEVYSMDGGFVKWAEEQPAVTS